MTDRTQVRIGVESHGDYEDERVCEHISLANVSKGFENPEYVQKIDMYCYECEREYRFLVGIN